MYLTLLWFDITSVFVVVNKNKKYSHDSIANWIFGSCNKTKIKTTEVIRRF